MDLQKFLPDKPSILDELLLNSNENKLIDGCLDDLLKLPVNENYKNNQERIKREQEQKQIKEIKTEVIELNSNIDL
jgi:hypothetical protein